MWFRVFYENAELINEYLRVGKANIDWRDHHFHQLNSEVPHLQD
jgi:hypothetical protein